MTDAERNKELDEARAKEAYELWCRDQPESDDDQVETAKIAARLAREAAEARIAELEAALAKANEPRWFYSDACAPARWSLEEALEQVTDDIRDLYHAEDMPKSHLVEIETSRPCPTIWGVLQLLADDEAEARGCKDPWAFTPCATEAEARALLKEGEQ